MNIKAIHNKGELHTTIERTRDQTPHLSASKQSTDCATHQNIEFRTPYSISKSITS